MYESSHNKKKVNEEKSNINSSIKKDEVTNESVITLKKKDFALELLSEINKQQANKLPSKIPGFFEKDTGNGNEIKQINKLTNRNSTNQNTIIFNSLLSELVNYCDRAENDGVFQLRLLLCNLIPEQDTEFIKEQLNQEELGKVVCQLKELIDQPINKEGPKVKQFNLKLLFNFLVELEKEPSFKKYDDMPVSYFRRLNKQ